MRVASAVIAVLGAGAAFASSSPLFWDGLLERGSWGITSAVLILACLFALVGGTVEGLLSRTRPSWLPVLVLVVFSVVAYWPFGFFAGRLSPHDEVPLPSWLPVTVATGWVLCLALNYVVFRLVRAGRGSSRGPERRPAATTVD